MKTVELEDDQILFLSFLLGKEAGSLLKEPIDEMPFVKWADVLFIINIQEKLEDATK